MTDLADTGALAPPIVRPRERVVSHLPPPREAISIYVSWPVIIR